MSLLPVHRSGRNGANQRVLLAQCKCDVKPSLTLGSPEGVKTKLRLTVLGVRTNDERLTKENLLNLRLRYAVFLILSCVSFIPVEAKNPRQIHASNYDVCFRHIQRR